MSSLATLSTSLRRALARWATGLRRALVRRVTARHVALAAVAGTWAWLYLAGLGDVPLRTWDESRYATPAMHMADGASWLDPRLQVNTHDSGLDARIRLHKPPLVYWLQATAMTAFGATAFAARLPSALATLCLAFLAFRIGRYTYDARAGLAAALALLAFPGFLYGTHGGVGAVPDAPLALFGSLFVWLTWRARERPRLLVPAGICAGLAVMTKGFAAGVFVVVLAPVLALWWRAYRSRWTVAAVASTLAVALPWHVYAAVAYPREFVDQYFLVAVGSRIRGDLPDPPAEPLVEFLHYPYLRFAARVFVPPYPYGLPLFAVGLACGLAVVWRLVRRDGRRAHRGKLLLVWWLAAVPLTFAIGGGNQPWYLMPMYLPGAVVLGYVPAAVADGTAGRTLRGLGTRLSSPERSSANRITDGGSVGDREGARSGEEHRQSVGTGRTEASRPLRSSFGRRDAVFLVFCVGFVLLFATATGPPVVESYDVEQRALGSAIASEVPAGETLYVWLGEHGDTRSLMALSFYADRRLERIDPAALGSDRSVEYAVVPFDRYDRLDGECRLVASGPRNGIVVVAFDDIDPRTALPRRSPRREPLATAPPPHVGDHELLVGAENGDALRGTRR